MKNLNEMGIVSSKIMIEKLKHPSLNGMFQKLKSPSQMRGA